MHLRFLRLILGLLILLELNPIQPVYAAGNTPNLNLPFFGSNAVTYGQSAITWYGKVTTTENYTDIRAGYNNSELFIYLQVFDKRLWYDPNPTSTSDLTKYDAVSVFIDTSNLASVSPTANTFKFVTQLSNTTDSRYVRAYQGNGTGFSQINIPFTATPGWRGDGPNNNVDDRGWGMTLRIPFSSLGANSPPPPGSIWPVAFTTHDRDDSIGTAIADKSWPESFLQTNPMSWGYFTFGSPTFSPPPVSNPQTVTIYDKLNGQTVLDGQVGGDSVCGGSLNYWTQWGDANYNDKPHANIQNQLDVADWPCFSKFYITFPLSSLPSGKAVTNANLKLHMFGNAGDGVSVTDSFIHVLTTNNSFDPATITWNNAPQPLENISMSVVPPMQGPLVGSGEERNFDLSYAVNRAYQAGETSLKLALYSSDTSYHSGKYFTRSNAGDWNQVARPTLEISLGTATTLPLPSKIGDITGLSGYPDNKVDIFDYNQVLTDFGKTGTNLISDIEKSGTSLDKVDIFDYNLLLTNFGK